MVLTILAHIFDLIQFAGVVLAIVAFIRERHEDPRFEGDKLIYRS
jgi:hypothetical protein